MPVSDSNNLMKFHLIFQLTDDGLAAHSADFPHLNATGCTIAEVENKMHDAIQGHVEALQAHGKRAELLNQSCPPVEV